MPERQFYEFGRFSLDSTGRLLLREGKPVPITPKVADTLLLLVENAGNVVDKEELLKKVWPDEFVEEGSLARSISVLRKALGDGVEGQEFIATIPKRGYRFVAPVTLRHGSVSQATGARVAGPPQPQTPEYQPVMRNRLIVIGAVLLLLLLAYIPARRFFMRSQPPGRKMIIAVLPFQNLTGDSTQEFVSDGLTEEMITRLSALNYDQLGVIARTSTMRYKGTNKPVDQIGGELGANYILEGSVRSWGPKVRISAQLIQVSDQTHLWAQSYERNSGDILALQADVAQAIAGQINVTLTPHVRTQFLNPRSVTPEAYDQYLKGRYFFNKFTLQGTKDSLNYFQQAIQRDPAYAPAHASLAYTYITLSGAFGALAPGEGFQKAKQELNKSLSLDDSQADAHSSLAWVKLHYDWEMLGAEREFRRAIEIDPNNSQAHHFYAHYLTAMGRTGEAWNESSRTLQLDPSGIRANAHQGWHHFFSRDYDQAIRDFQRTLAMEPNDLYSRRYLANAYQQKKMYAEALAELSQIAPGAAATPVMRAALGYAHAVAGNRLEAANIAKELEQRAKQQYVSAFDIGLIYLGLGEKDQALAWLEKSFQERGWYLVYLRVDPRFDGLRSDQHFQDLLRRIGLS